RILHYPRVDGRRAGHDDRHADPARDRDEPELGPGGRAFAGAAGDHHAVVCDLLPLHPDRPHDGQALRRRMKALPWVNSFTALLCVVLISPIFIVMVLSFSGDALLQFPPRSFSLRWYENFFGDSRWRDALYNSLVIGLGACLIATSVGFLAAYALVRGKFKAKKLALSFI